MTIKLDCVNLIGLGAAHRIGGHTPGCVWVSYGGMTWGQCLVLSLPLWHCSPVLPPSCHELSSFAPPHLSAMMALPWSQVTMN